MENEGATNSDGIWNADGRLYERLRHGEFIDETLDKLCAYSSICKIPIDKRKCGENCYMQKEYKKYFHWGDEEDLGIGSLM